MGMPLIPESLLRTIWQRQLFTTSELHTADEKRVTILSPGVSNSDGGPDFLNARIRIGNITYRGDVELHVTAPEWHQHNHGVDPHYNRVILHVVFGDEHLAPPAQTASARPIPLLVLHPFLDQSLLQEMLSALSGLGQARGTLPCRGRTRHITRDLLEAWIGRLAYERIEFKISRFEDRLKALIDEKNNVVQEPYPRYYGNPDEIPPPRKQYTRQMYTAVDVWEQLLYEGIMEAMGYSKNSAPFVRLAQSMRLRFLQNVGLCELHQTTALLFGTAGLLPSIRTVSEKDSRGYVRPLRRTWKEYKTSFTGDVLNEADWLFFRLRPQNFPTARLAAVCFLLPSLFGKERFRNLVKLFKSDGPTSTDRMKRLAEALKVTPDEFWSHHFHFRGKAGRVGIALGEQRIHEIVLNAIVPVLLLYARIFRDNAVRIHTRMLVESLPSTEENSITRAMTGDLLAGKMHLSTSFMQQGAIQLFKFYCSANRCAECEVGKRVDFSRGAS